MAAVLAPCWTCPAGEDICRCTLRAAAVPVPEPIDLDALLDEFEAVTSS